MFFQRQNKYGNKISTYGDHTYHSAKEAGYAQELDFRVKAKDIKSWRRQIPLELRVYGEKICTYTIDFEITHNDKSIELVEVKGFETPEWRLKWKLVNAIWGKEFPKIILTVVK